MLYLHVQVDARLQKKFENLDIAQISGYHERGRSGQVLDVDVGTAFDQDAGNVNNVYKFTFGSVIQCSVAMAIVDVTVSSRRDQDLHNVCVVSFNGLHQRRPT